MTSLYHYHNEDKVEVGKNFIKNADALIKRYSNYSLFSSLYVPYDSFFIKNRKYINHAKYDRILCNKTCYRMIIKFIY